jgi:hypothetical protein
MIMSRTAQRVLLVVGWLLIFGLTVNAVIQDGLALLYNWAFGASSLLILTDLVVELTLISIFIWVDARRRGRNPVPWIVTTLIFGGVGSLGYLLARTFDPDAPPVFGGVFSAKAGSTR